MKSRKSLSNFLNDRCKERGEKARIREKTGFSGSQIDGYFTGDTGASIDQLDRLAEALEIEPWELIKPGSATDNDLRMRVKNETAAFVRREKELLEMVEASLGIGGRPGMQRFLELASKLDDAGIKHHVSVLEAYLGLRSSKLKK